MTNGAYASASNAFEAIKVAHDTVMAASYELGTILQREAKTLSEGELADIGFLFRETNVYADAIRKEANAKQALVGQILCVRITERSMQDAGNTPMRAVGKLASATPLIKAHAQLPPSKSQKYKDLLTELGVNKECAENGLLSLHWKNIGEYLTELEAQGKTCPFAGLELTKHEPTVTYRRKSNSQ